MLKSLHSTLWKLLKCSILATLATLKLAIIFHRFAKLQTTSHSLTDGDMFSTYESLRGSNWRGKDCDDNSNSVFPGRYDPDVANDNNCNGIFGVDPNTNVPYEN